MGTKPQREDYEPITAARPRQIFELLWPGPLEPYEHFRAGLLTPITTGCAHLVLAATTEGHADLLVRGRDDGAA